VGEFDGVCGGFNGKDEEDEGMAWIVVRETVEDGAVEVLDIVEVLTGRDTEMVVGGILFRLGDTCCTTERVGKVEEPIYVDVVITKVTRFCRLAILASIFKY